MSDLLEEGKRRRERARRLQADQKAREEIRNAARKALAEEGFTREALQREIKSLAAQTVKEFAASSDMKALMVAAVRTEVDRQLKASHTTLETIVRDAIRGAAQAHAAAYIEKVVNINIKDAW
jgi:hypothetical protein